MELLADYGVLGLVAASLSGVVTHLYRRVNRLEKLLVTSVRRADQYRTIAEVAIERHGDDELRRRLDAITERFGAFGLP